MVVQVTFDVREPETHLVRVTQRFAAAPGAERRFRMPAWVPGSYKIRDFGRNVQDVEVRVGGKKAAVRQTGKDEWTVAAAGHTVELAFRVYGRELTVDTSHVTSDHAHLLPATLMLYDEHSRNQPHRVRLQMPRGWRAWSGLETAASRGELEMASDYDHLIDCPIECGPPADYHVERFVARGRRHRIVVWKPPTGVKWKRINHDVKAIVNETARVFGSLPYRHYTFLCHVAAGHGGGLEHCNSTVLGIDPNHLLAEEKIAQNLLPLVCHEFFHTWNVKRIQPAAFQPYDLQRESYTDLLWLFEGFTSYYELPILHRARVVTDEQWGKLVAEMLEFYEKALGRKRTSVAQASRLTWTLLYQPHEHNVNRNVSYYTKGLFVGLCLDAHLRKRRMRGGLDVVMRHLWKRHATDGLADDAFPALVREATGIDARALLKRWVDGTEELPIDASLRSLGWDVKREWKDPKHRNGLGIHFKPQTASIERIPENVPAWHVLQPDDEVVAADGFKWDPLKFPDLAASKRPGDKVEIAVFREGRLRRFDVPLVQFPKDKITVVPRKKDAAGARRRTAWLGLGKKSKAKGGASPEKPRRTVRF